MRSAMLRSASSIGMPRFCSSKTRLNSSAIGPFISSATRCRPEARPWPAQGPADQLDGLGHGVDELLDPALLALQQPEERQRRQEGRRPAGSRRSAGGNARRRPPRPRARPTTRAMNELKLRLTSACS